jgi:hypothetical protein
MHRAEVSSTVSMPPAVIDKEAIQQMEKRMKANINFRTTDDHVVSCVIEPVIKRGLHSVRIQRMTADQKGIIGISRFHVDNESEALDFLSESSCG